MVNASKTRVRAQALPLELGGSHAPLWWGVAMLVVIEVVVYATLFTAYLYLRFHTPEWPPAGVPRPPVVLGSAGMLLLLGGAAAVRWGVVGILDDDARRLARGFGIAAVLGVGTLVLLGVERAAAGFRWDDHAYGSLIWTIHVVHGLHVFTLVVIGAAVRRLAGQPVFSREHRIGPEVLAMYWYCVALVWLPVFALVYLVAW